MYFIRTALNNLRNKQGLHALDAFDFMSLVKEKAKLLNMDESFLERAFNVGFSGGEKKRNEILQMLLLEPKFAVLDEIDSGLDIDALRVIARGVNALRDNKRAILLVTHYQRLLQYIIPDFVHVMIKGQIVKSGAKELAEDLERTGYDKGNE
jgi:Fe-S cluster assembly ATP-binding protein